MAGIVLCGYLIFVLNELAKHIKNYWTTADRIAGRDDELAPLIGDRAAKVREQKDCYTAGYPPFIKRLYVPPVLFALAHFGWALYTTFSPRR